MELTARAADHNSGNEEEAAAPGEVDRHARLDTGSLRAGGAAHGCGTSAGTDEGRSLLARADGLAIDGFTLQRMGLEYQVTTWRIVAC